MSNCMGGLNELRFDGYRMGLIISRRRKPPCGGSESLLITAAALDRVKALVSPRQYQIFDCYVIKGWGVKKTAEVLGINVTQVYLAKHRVGALVKKEVQALKGTMP